MTHEDLPSFEDLIGKFRPAADERARREATVRENAQRMQAAQAKYRTDRAPILRAVKQERERRRLEQQREFQQDALRTSEYLQDMGVRPDAYPIEGRWRRQAAWVVRIVTITAHHEERWNEGEGYATGTGATILTKSGNLHFGGGIDVSNDMYGAAVGQPREAEYLITSEGWEDLRALHGSLSNWKLGQPLHEGLGFDYEIPHLRDVLANHVAYWQAQTDAGGH